MGTGDGRTRLDTEAVGVDSVKSEIDDYIESLWMLVMTQWQHSNGLLAGSVSEELTTFSKQQPKAPLDRSKSVDVAFKVLEFISNKEESRTWVAIEKRFDDLTKDTNGLLPRLHFWECIGMNKDSQDFAGVLFDSLSLRANIKGELINKDQMYEFWNQISDQSFDSRLHTFFDMIDKDADGRITENDVREIIILSASANKLSHLQNQADEYAALIMEELDPDNNGYIMIENLEKILLQAPEGNERAESPKLKTTESSKPIRRWYENFRLAKVLFKGKYGAPAQDYKKYSVVLLVGSGMGATPMINIVKDILNNIEAKEEENGSTGEWHKKKSGPTNFETTRAYFYWVTSEQRSFDMVKDIMNDAAEMDKYDVIDMHAYCTRVFEEDDARSALIKMVESLNHAKNGVDVVSASRVKTYFAKPNWFETYMHIALKHSGSRIGVFYGGEPASAKELKQLAHEFSHKTSTKFDFCKQNF